MGDWKLTFNSGSGALQRVHNEHCDERCNLDDAVGSRKVTAQFAIETIVSVTGGRIELVGPLLCNLGFAAEGVSGADDGTTPNAPPPTPTIDMKALRESSERGGDEGVASPDPADPEVPGATEPQTIAGDQGPETVTPPDAEPQNGTDPAGPTREAEDAAAAEAEDEAQKAQGADAAGQSADVGAAEATASDPANDKAPQTAAAPGFPPSEGHSAAGFAEG